jgi:hypothetical protein
MQEGKSSVCPLVHQGRGQKCKKKIISQLHAVDRIFGFTYIKFLSIFALFEDSDELVDIYIYFGVAIMLKIDEQKGMECTIINA